MFYYFTIFIILPFYRFYHFYHFLNCLPFSDISTEHLQTESGTGEVLNYQEIKTGLTDIFSKLVKKELEKLDDDASQSDDLNSPESKIKTNLDKPIGEKFITDGWCSGSP